LRSQDELTAGRPTAAEKNPCVPGPQTRLRGGRRFLRSTPVGNPLHPDDSASLTR